MAKFKKGDRVLVLPDKTVSHVFRPYTDTVGLVATVNDYADETGCGVTFDTGAAEYTGYDFLEPAPAAKVDTATELLRRVLANEDDIRVYLSAQEKKG